jgi:radical SAM protein with 4Fe4S-binding SPASM domain
MELQSLTGQSSPARIVMWELTRACRLACTHCPVGAQQRRNPLELSTYEAYKTLDQIVALHPDELVITGGDPFERADLYQLIDYARRRGLHPALTVSATPGLTGASIGKLKLNGLSRLIISIDSPTPERHDAARGVSGQFATSLLALRWARTAELPVEVNTLVTRRNISDLTALAHLLADVEIQRWNIYFVVPIGSSKELEMLTAEETERVFEKLYELGASVPIAIRTFEAPQYRRFVYQKAIASDHRSVESLFDPTVIGDNEFSGLGLARVAADMRNMLFISHTGEVSISPFLPLTAGNVRYQPLTSLYRYGDMFGALRDEANLKGKCSRCEFKKVCGGSRARAFAVSGDLFATDPQCAYEPGAFVSTAAVLQPPGGAA